MTEFDIHISSSSSEEIISTHLAKQKQETKFPFYSSSTQKNKKLTMNLLVSEQILQEISDLSINLTITQELMLQLTTFTNKTDWTCAYMTIQTDLSH